MKNTLFLFSLFFGLNNAHAIHCSLNKLNPDKKLTYDLPVFTEKEIIVEEGASQLIIIRNDNSLVDQEAAKTAYISELEISELDNLPFFKLTRHEDASISFSIGHIDATEPQNLSAVESIGSKFREGQKVSASDGKLKISLSCH